LTPDPAWTSKLVPELEQDLLTVTNAARKAGGRGALVFEPSLVASAQYGALFLANYGLLLHDYPAESGHPALAYGASLDAAGYHGVGGANAGYAWMDAAGMLGAFLSAGPGEGHYDNVMDEDWNCCGMGCAVSASGVHFWVQDFGILPYSGLVPVISGISPAH